MKKYVQGEYEMKQFLLSIIFKVPKKQKIEKKICKNQMVQNDECGK